MKPGYVMRMAEFTPKVLSLSNKLYVARFRVGIGYLNEESWLAIFDHN